VHLQLAGKTALVTGSSKGIGRAIALKLAEEGVKVMLTARDGLALEAVAQEIRGRGGEAVTHAADLTAPSEPERLIDSLGERLGGLDILVNSAGATRAIDFLASTAADLQNAFALKLFAQFLLTRAAWPLLKNKKGTVLAIVGIRSRTPDPDAVVASAVNAACVAFMKAVADLGVRDGIQVNVINPGSVQTERFARSLLRRHMAATGLDEAAAKADIPRAYRMTRLGVPEDIAALAAFVVSPPARWLQGSIIDMDGGITKSL
jgi:3-oxoacyl-[acyl-carrier protein] reductase